MKGFRIGRLFGIDLRIDVSWIVIFVLLTWNLVAVFSGWHPTWSPLETFGLALVGSLVFFGCVLIHELAHAAVATSYGGRVRSITLFLFGGVADTEREPESAHAEFFTAIVGPVASIVLGACFLVIAAVAAPVLLQASGSPWSAEAGVRLGPVGTLLVWLGPINIMIGFFNLLPAFPLDGGRVLRSIIWGATRDLATATRWASATGQTIGWVLIGVGIAMTFGVHVPFFGTGLVSGIWLGFIGWFLHGAASQAATRVALDDALAGLRVDQLMQGQGPVAGPELSVAALVHEHLIPGDDRALPVVISGRLVGLVSISEVRSVPPDRWPTTSVGSIMRRLHQLHVATPDESVTTAFEQLARHDIEQLPVVANGMLVGMLRRRDITRWLELAWRPRGGPAPAPATRATSDPGAAHHHPPFDRPHPHHA